MDAFFASRGFPLTRTSTVSYTSLLMFRLTVKPGQAYPPQIPSVGSCRLQIHLCILACVMVREFSLKAVTKCLPAQFPWIWCKISSKKFNPFKDFQSDQIQRSSRKIFTTHYTCRKAEKNLTSVTGTTNGFIFQIINSLIESWGVSLTCLDCNGKWNAANWEENVSNVWTR